MFIIIRYIIFVFIFNFLLTKELTDTVLISNKENVKNKSSLIPIYNDKTSFKTEYLGKTKKLFLEIDLSYLNSLYPLINFSPIYDYKKNRFKINLDYFFNSDNEIKNDWNDFISIIERVEYLNLSFFEEKIEFNIGELRNISFGHGYLLHNYCNNFNYPNNRDAGFNLKIQNNNKSFSLKLFGSSIRDIYNNGGLIGLHLSFLVSSSLPIKFGLGYISDKNQLVNNENILNSLEKRQIDGFEFDIELPILSKIKLIGEFSALKFPETRYYQRTDDSQFTNDKKSRNGSWGLLFPGFRYTSKNNFFQLGLNYNSSIHIPHFFNITYDFEKMRYREYDIFKNEILFSSESELLENYQTSNDSLIIYIPKDLYSMISGYENIYQTAGISLSSFIEFNVNNSLSFEYSNFVYLDTNSESLPFHSIFMSFNRKINLIFFDSKMNFFLSKEFINEKEFLTNKENTIFGANLEFILSKKMSIFLNYRNTFFDSDYDGLIDNNKFMNTGIKLKF